MKPYEHCIKKPLNATRDHHHAHHWKSHHDDVMPRWKFCADGYFPESPIRVNVRQIKSIPSDYEPHVELHTHDIDELYIFISEEEGGLEAEITMDEEAYTVTSPVTVLLPKGVPHCYALKKGHGFVFVIMPLSCKEHYNQHTFPYSI